MEGKNFKIIPNFTSERKNVVIKDRKFFFKKKYFFFHKFFDLLNFYRF